MHAQAWCVAGLYGLCAANVGDRPIDLERGAAPAAVQAQAQAPVPPDPGEDWSTEKTQKSRRG